MSRWAGWLFGLALTAIVITAFAPAYDVFLVGDDFELLDASYRLFVDPLAGFELINNFFRPLVKWTFAIDYLIFGDFAPGYMLTNIGIHLVNVLLLYMLMARHLRRSVAAAASAAFALSPLDSEAVLWASSRGDTVLLVFWLGALLLLDWDADSPPRSRFAVFLVTALLGIGAKESWVLFPLIATGFLVLVKGSSPGSAVRRLWILWLAFGAYLVVFILRPILSGSSSPTYYADFGFQSAVAKTSRTLLGFLGLGGAEFGATAALVLAAFVVFGAMLAAWYTKNGFAQWAVVWMLATLALSAPFPVAPLRHNYLPLVGFWMAVAAFADHAFGKDGSGRTWNSLGRRVSSALVMAGVFAVLVVEGRALQLEIDDYRCYGEVHRELCGFFDNVAPAISGDRPLLLINHGTRAAVEEVVNGVEGVDKTFFVRRDALWQLVFLPPLVNFMGTPFEVVLRSVGETEISEALAGEVTVVYFDDSGFRLLPDAPSAVAESFARTGRLPPGTGLFQYEIY
ncbi:MAG: hypothetical protein KAI97_00920 [Gemmatimonadetes bacterium]|nr:hypothetical protein [Gemmatimonadota bacterium]